MRKLLTLAALGCTSLLLAQHCPFDNTGIIVLDIHAEGKTQVMPGVKAYLADSAGKPILQANYRDHRWGRDTLWFWQNPPETTFSGYIDNTNPAEEEKIRFPFAADNYVCVVPREFSLEHCKILIRHPAYPLIGVRGNLTEVFPLCGTYNREEYHSSLHRIVYKPLDVVLPIK